MNGYNIAGETFNTCQKCGTVNYFDTTITDMFSRAHCYHCGELVDVPDPPEFMFTPSTSYWDDTERIYKWRLRGGVL